MQNTSQTIEATIRSFGRGKIFFADDFVGTGTPEAIRQALLRLSKAGERRSLTEESRLLTLYLELSGG